VAIGQAYNGKLNTSRTLFARCGDGPLLIKEDGSTAPKIVECLFVECSAPAVLVAEPTIIQSCYFELTELCAVNQPLTLSSCLFFGPVPELSAAWSSVTFDGPQFPFRGTVLDLRDSQRLATCPVARSLIVVPLASPSKTPMATLTPRESPVTPEETPLASVSPSYAVVDSVHAQVTAKGGGSMPAVGFGMVGVRSVEPFVATLDHASASPVSDAIVSAEVRPSELEKGFSPSGVICASAPPDGTGPPIVGVLRRPSARAHPYFGKRRIVMMGVYSAIFFVFV
jgi:hypothetical protein